MEQVMPALTFIPASSKGIQRLAICMALLNLLSFTACEKVELPEPTPDAPDFYTELVQINNQALNWTAGENDIYMHTTIQPLNDSLQVYTGSFGLTDCDSCKQSLHFDFINYKSNPSFQAGALSYMPQLAATPGIKVKVEWAINGGIAPLTSLFNPGDANTFVNFQNGAAYEYGGAGPYTMRLSISDALNRTVTTEQHVASMTADDALLEIQYIDSAGLLLAQVNHPGPISYVWSNGSTSSSLALSNAGIYSVMATLPNGTQLSQSIHYQPGIQPSVFSVQLKSTRLKSTGIAAGQTRIRFIDNNGQLWSSALGQQGLGESFQVLEVLPYPEKDRAGRLVLQAKVQFSCQLYNSKGDSIPASGIAWLAIPKN